MKNKLFTIITLFLGLVVALGCSSKKETESQNNTNMSEPSTETKSVDDDSYETKNNPVNNSDFTALVGKWNDAHNTKDIGTLASLYEQNVMFYGSPMDKNECIENKLAFFKKKTDFTQEITEEILVENLSPEEVKCSFNKKVTVDGKTTEYPSYLRFHKVGDKWKISVESDLVTDENLAKRAKKNILTQEMGIRSDVPGTYDFNGDGKKETCYLLEPKKYNDEDRIMECEGECKCLIMFSDSNIPPIEVENCIGGNPKIYGDLDGNGTIEIGIWPWWWTSCWHTFYIYTLVNNQWEYFVAPFSVHCILMEELEESGEPIIKAVEGKKDMFRIRYSYYDEVEIELKEGTEIVRKLTN